MNTKETLLYNQVKFDCEIFTTLLKGEEVDVETLQVALSDGLDVLSIASGNGDGNCGEGQCHA